jgi:hypothetical protein
MSPQEFSLLAELAKLFAALVTLLVAILAFAKVRQKDSSSNAPLPAKSFSPGETLWTFQSLIYCMVITATLPILKKTFLRLL